MSHFNCNCKIFPFSIEMLEYIEYNNNEPYGCICVPPIRLWDMRWMAAGVPLYKYVQRITKTIT